MVRPSPDRITLVSAYPAEPGYAATDNPVWADILTGSGCYREATREEWLAEKDRVSEEEALRRSARNPIVWGRWEWREDWLLLASFAGALVNLFHAALTLAGAVIVAGWLLRRRE